MKRYVSQGVTLIELIIVVAILSILLTIAVPSFSNLILSNQISSDLSDFVGALRRAKTESSARLTPVTICIRGVDVPDVNFCRGTAWQNGWLVFLDNNGNGLRELSEIIIYEQAALGRQVTFRETNNVPSITFTPTGNGATLANPVTFVMCSPDQQTIRRGISVTVAGQSFPLNNPGVCQ